MIVLQYCIIRLQKLIPDEPQAQGLKVVLEKLVLLYSLSSLEKYLTIFYQG